MVSSEPKISFLSCLRNRGRSTIPPSHQRPSAPMYHVPSRTIGDGAFLSLQEAVRSDTGVTMTIVKKRKDRVMLTGVLSMTVALFEKWKTGPNVDGVGEDASEVDPLSLAASPPSLGCPVMAPLSLVR
jgi:hypothetical protein